MDRNVVAVVLAVDAAFFHCRICIRRQWGRQIVANPYSLFLEGCRRVDGLSLLGRILPRNCQRVQQSTLIQSNLVVTAAGVIVDFNKASCCCWSFDDVCVFELRIMF